MNRRSCFQHLNLFVADGFTVVADRRFHGQIRQDLEKMVLHHVANGPGLIVEGASPFDAEIFRHGDLNAFDMVSVPERFREGVCKPENDQVVHRPLTEVVVNPKNRRLREYRMQCAVEFLC